MLRAGFVILAMLLAVLSVSALQPAPDFIQASVDNPTPYLGQPVIYTWQWFLASASADTNNDARITMPDFAGFGQKTLPQEANQSQVVNGQQYQVVTQQIVLYPLLPGPTTITPLRIAVPESPFQAAAVLETAPISLNILPLPPGAPENFENAVGQFDISAELNSTSTTAGQPVMLTVTVTGTGNTERLLTPDLPVGAAWRSYANPPRFVQDTPQVGRQIFSWTLIPLQAGVQTIPPVTLSFFNPLTTHYESRATNVLTLDVLQGDFTPAPLSSPIPAATFVQSGPVFKTLPAVLGRDEVMPGNVFWLLWLIPPFIAGFFWLRGSRAAVAAQPRIASGSRAFQQAQSQLKTAATLAPGEAFERVRAVLLAYLSAKAGQKLSRDMVQPAIQGLPETLQKRLLQAIEQAEGGRYAPVTPADAADLVKMAGALLAQVDKQWRKS